MLSKFGYIYFSPNADFKNDRVVSETGGMTTILVAVADVELAPVVACEMVENGVELIELCGIFGPIGASKVLAATEHKVPVGFVTYGIETVVPLAGLIAS